MKHVLASLLFSTPLLLAQGPSPTPAGDPKPIETPAQPAKDQPPKDQPSKDQPAPAKTPAPESGGQQPATPPAGDQPKPEQPAKQDPAKDPANPTSGDAQQPAGDQPVPRGADPADLAAIRSAEAMIQAERKLQELIKSGKIEGLDKVVTFDELSAWPYEDGLKGMPKRVRELDGKKVLMSGFMLPIDEVQNIKEFLLVQSLWSCCYGTPPDINGIVRVVMPEGKTTDYFFDPLKIIGTFKVEATVMDGYCLDIYQLHLESIEALK